MAAILDPAGDPILDPAGIGLDEPTSLPGLDTGHLHLGVDAAGGIGVPVSGDFYDGFDRVDLNPAPDGHLYDIDRWVIEANAAEATAPGATLGLPVTTGKSITVGLHRLDTTGQELDVTFRDGAVNVRLETVLGQSSVTVTETSTVYGFVQEVGWDTALPAGYLSVVLRANTVAIDWNGEQIGAVGLLHSFSDTSGYITFTAGTTGVRFDELSVHIEPVGDPTPHITLHPASEGGHLRLRDVAVLADEDAIDMAGAIRGPVAYGPRITQPGTVIPPIVARLFRLRDHRTPIATLDQSFNRTWQEQIGDAGSGSLSLLNDDPDLALVRDGDVIRFELHGEYAFSFVVTDRQKTTIAAGEEHDEVTVLSGPGLLAWLTRSMLIYPARQPPQLLAGPIAERVIQQDVVDENRTFSWASYDMLIDADRYVPVANLGNMEVTPPGWPPGLTVDRIGPPDSTAENTPPGIVYYRFGFEVTDTEAEIFLWSPARDPLTIWVDGSLMDDSDGGVEEDEVRNVSVSTAATGDTTHNISVAVNHQGEGVGWIAVLGLGVNEDGDYTGSSVMTSNAGWYCIPYPPEPPPVTAMAVLTAAVGEMNSRRYNPQLGFVGGEEVDAGGTPWPPLPEITTKVGTTVWDFLQEMAPFVEVWMGANPRQLWVWVAGKRATEVNVNLHGVTDPTDTQSGNLRGLVHRRAT